ncbi:MAG: hypothetical protein H0U60_19590 [Blastocatellia bacterium]|nr:hypothetical protein [Blastocatellia bacterium]
MSELALDKMYESTTYRVQSPDGTMFVIIADDESGKPIHIQINIGKSGAAVGAWSHGLARLMTIMLTNGFGINDLIRELSETTTSKLVTTSDGMIPIRSGIDAVCVALMMYRKDKFRGLLETLNGGEPEEEYRGPTLG